MNHKCHHEWQQGTESMSEAETGYVPLKKIMIDGQVFKLARIATKV